MSTVKKTKAVGYYRVISGLLRKQKIPIIQGFNIRPTADRVRETIFNWLMHDIAQAHCLDLFCGAGSLAIEAYSRGAQSVYAYEKNPIIYQHLQTIIQKHALNIHLRCQDATKLSKPPQQLTQPFDIIFIDPPFNQAHLLEKALSIIYPHFTHANSLLYIEQPHQLQKLNLPAQCINYSKMGQVHAHLFQIHKTHSPPNTL